MIVIFLVLLSLNVQFFFYPNEYVANENEVVQDVNIIYCSPENISSLKYFYEIWVNIDLLVNVLLPFAIMIISSLIIVVSLLNSTKNLTVNKQLKKKPKTLVTSVDESRNEVNLSLLESNTIGQCQNGKIQLKKVLNIEKKKTSTQSTVSSKAKNVSAMLATNNLLFISLTLPIVVFLSIQPSIDQTCDLVKAKLLLIKVFCIILMNANCTINIFIYILMSSQFKLELFSIISNINFLKKSNLVEITASKT
jgi:hypothetical protein